MVIVPKSVLAELEYPIADDGLTAFRPPRLLLIVVWLLGRRLRWCATRSSREDPRLLLLLQLQLPLLHFLHQLLRSFYLRLIRWQRPVAVLPRAVP